MWGLNLHKKMLLELLSQYLSVLLNKIKGGLKTENLACAIII
jgi:hypothetical protein